MITIARGWLISVLAGSALIAAGKPGEAEWIIWLPGLCYLAIGCGDFIDGLVARLTRTESLLGKRLDISMDALGLLVASAAAVFLKRLPPAFLLVGLSYYLFHSGLTHRRVRGKIVRSLADRPFGRAMAGVHMGFVGLALIPAFSETLLKHAAMLFMLPFLFGFVWDWLVVTGRLGDEAADRWGCFSSIRHRRCGCGQAGYSAGGYPCMARRFCHPAVRRSGLDRIVVHDGLRVAGSISGRGRGGHHCRAPAARNAHRSAAARF
jgi:phosphatidylglycerophosphate synthase